MSQRSPATAYPYAYHGGHWVVSAEAVIPVSSQAMRYALSVFEGVRLYRQDGAAGVAPFRLTQHLDRLRNSLALTRIPASGLDGIPHLVEELVERNRVAADAYVRIAVSAGNPGLIGTEVEPLLTISVTPMGRKRWLAEQIGMRLQISTWQRAAERSFPAAAKNISGYAGARLALLEARDAGFDGCVLTNGAGRLCEAPTAAVFLVSDGVLVTPSLTEGVLPSITRQWVLDAAAGLGVAAQERPVARAEAYRAEEAFLCGTGIEFAPVESIDGHRCARWPAAPVTHAVVARYFEEVRGAHVAARQTEGAR